MSGFNDFAYGQKLFGCFIVYNKAIEKKIISIFNYPIGWHCSRDLLAIPGVAESDIKASLLKGTLKHKILCNEIVVMCSDIDLIQFNADQKAFLQSAGIVTGLSAGGSGNLNYSLKQGIVLTGPKDGVNRTFHTPDKFLNQTLDGNEFKIEVFHNGRRLIESIDYVVASSGFGFDMVTFVSFIPAASSQILANYAVNN
jgi:hypothetical protein